MPGSAFARNLRKESTWAEKLLWRWLRDRRFIEYKFRRQYPVGEYFLDFFCFEAKLSIELDGSQHGFPEEQSHDMARTAYLEKKGIKELRFWNSELRRNAQGVRDTIFRGLQERAPHPLPEYVSRTGALTPALSQREREKHSAALQSNYRNTPERPPIPPLPLGEGRGEGPHSTTAAPTTPGTRLGDSPGPRSVRSA